jgi:hypothetical protein
MYTSKSNSERELKTEGNIWQIIENLTTYDVELILCHVTQQNK